MNTYTKISLNIIAIFLVAIAGNFIPEMFPSFFGDFYCHGFGSNLTSDDNCTYAGHGYHASEFHWGLRHWLWMLMSLCLFALQVVRIIKIIKEKL